MQHIVNDSTMITDKAPPESDTPDPLVQLSGYFQMDLGLGHNVRLMAQVLKHAKIPFGYKNYTKAGPHRAKRPWAEDDSKADHAPIHICGVNMDNVMPFWEDHPEMFVNNRYLIGIWFWEVPVIPNQFLKSIEAVDEIWVPTEYLRDIFKRYCNKPVLCYPQPIAIAKSIKPEASERKVFRFYFSFDFCSLVRRKNPDGLIRAFLRAFSVPGTAELLVKSVNGHIHSSELCNLRKMLDDAPHIHWIDGHLPQDDLQRLLENVDGYASLHRSEGYGLTIAEAMASGKPVLATGYSGNMTFMNESNSFPVPFDLVPVGPGALPYPAEALWAEPNEEIAAKLMVQMVTDRTLRAAKVAKATSDIRRLNSMEACSTWVHNRVNLILNAMNQIDSQSGVTWPPQNPRSFSGATSKQPDSERAPKPRHRFLKRCKKWFGF
jgi:glycosyltransferase involved in cell wall biosynthesis